MFYNYDIKFVNGSVKNIIDIFFFSKNICCGASVFFLGYVRVSSVNKYNVRAIYYIIFEELAVNTIRRIFFNVFQIYGKFIFIQVIHSSGLVKVGDPSIFIKVCTSHKENAFEICNFVLKSVKKDAPIWKKEYTKDSIQWLLSLNKI